MPPRILAGSRAGAQERGQRDGERGRGAGRHLPRVRNPIFLTGTHQSVRQGRGAAASGLGSVEEASRGSASSPVLLEEAPPGTLLPRRVRAVASTPDEAVWGKGPEDSEEDARGGLDSGGRPRRVGREGRAGEGPREGHTDTDGTVSRKQTGGEGGGPGSGAGIRFGRSASLDHYRDAHRGGSDGRQAQWGGGMKERMSPLNIKPNGERRVCVGVGCGVWGVECGVWIVECGAAERRGCGDRGGNRSES